jgi:transposase
MARSTINPDPSCVQLEGIHPDHDGLTIILRTNRATVSCPDCGQLSDGIHSWYRRTLADLPWQGVAVRFRLYTRRWFCRHPACSRSIFTERLPDVVDAYARRTSRLAEVVEAVAFALGGEAGHRLLLTFGLTLSPDTLLNIIRTTVLSVDPSPRVVGIDDWAWRRRHSYGTIIVDLERHRVIELLPDRDPKTLTTWLKRQPQIEVIARDRWQGYIEAATVGAPQAQQVADRWHLVDNLVDAVEEMLLRKRTVLREAAQAARGEPESGEAPGDPTSGTIMPNRPRRRTQQLEELSLQRHQRIVERYVVIRRLHLAGADVADIARRVGTSRQTVYRYRKLAEAPERKQPTRRQTMLDPYVPYLLQRWNEGCHNGMRLWREICEQGFRGSSTVVSRFVAQLRRDEVAGRSAGSTARSRAARAPTARQVTRLFVRQQDDLTTEQQTYLSDLQRLDETVRTIFTLTQSFMAMMREQTGEQLKQWIEQAKGSGIGKFRRFAVGLEKDQAAVQAGLTEVWSNGQTEGHVHRLKLLKRQMYGRAGFDVLRPRMLRAA